MSKVLLKSFVVYRRGATGKPDIIYGATGSRQRPGNPAFSFKMGSVPLPGQPLPALPNGVIALLFGTSEIVEEIHRRWVEASAKKVDMHTAEVIAEVGDQKVGLFSHDDLASQQFVNVRRMNAELQSDFLRRVADLAEEGGDTAIADEIGERETEKTVGSKPALVAKKKIVPKKIIVIAGAQERMNWIGSRPDLVARIFTEDPEFKSVRVLVVPIYDREIGKRRPIALIKPGAVVELNQSLERDVLEFGDSAR